MTLRVRCGSCFTDGAYRFIPQPGINTVLVELMHARYRAHFVVQFIWAETNIAGRSTIGIACVFCEFSASDGVQRQTVDVGLGGSLVPPLLSVVVQRLQHLVVVTCAVIAQYTAHMEK